MLNLFFGIDQLNLMRLIQVIETWDHLLVEPLKIFSGNNNPYSVYGPFYKNLKSKMNLLGSYEQDKVGFQFKDIDNKISTIDGIVVQNQNIYEIFIKNNLENRNDFNIILDECSALILIFKFLINIFLNEKFSG